LFDTTPLEGGTIDVDVQVAKDVVAVFQQHT